MKKILSKPSFLENYDGEQVYSVSICFFCYKCFSSNYCESRQKPKTFMQSFQFVTVLYVNLFSGLFIVTCCRSFVVRFFTKIQDQIKNPDNSDFSLRKETMYRPVAMFFFTGRCDPTRRRTKWGRRGESLGGGGGGNFGCLRLNCVQVCSWGAHFKRVSVSQLLGSGGMLPRKSFKFKPSEMAGNAFKTNLVWRKHIFSATKNVAIKKRFLHKTHDTTTTILRTFDLVR